MPFYHVLIGYDDPKRSSRLVLYELGLSKNDVEVFVEQYKKGRVLFKGKWLDVLNIEEIEIQETQHPHDSWANIVPLVSVQDITISSRGTKAKDVTRQFVRSEPRKFVRKSANQSVSSKDVFVVHGHDIQSVKELNKMLVKFGLDPIVLHEQPSGSRTIVEKLEKYSDVGYAFVILTPDDLGTDRSEITVIELDQMGLQELHAEFAMASKTGTKISERKARMVLEHVPDRTLFWSLGTLWVC